MLFNILISLMLKQISFTHILRKNFEFDEKFDLAAVYSPILKAR
jgi:hypothetical protein